MSSDTEQAEREDLQSCGFCLLSQEMERNRSLVESDLLLYLEHLWVSHGVKLGAHEEVVRP